MKLVRGEHIRDTSNLVAIFVFGDGSEDIKIVEAMAERFDGKRLIFNPQLGGEKGIKSALRTIAILFDKLRLDWANVGVVIVIDKEYVEDYNKLEKVLLEFFNFKVVERNLDDRFFKFEIKRGPKETVLWIVVMGFTRRKEENEVILIKELLGENVDPVKRKIRNLLRRKGTSIRRLIRDADSRSLERAFDSLVKLFRELEKPM